MSIALNETLKSRLKGYFREEYDTFIRKLDEPCTKGFFLNTSKAEREEIFKEISFPYIPSKLTDDSFYHDEENIGKTVAYDLGLIYPQEIAASLTSMVIEGMKASLVVDLCAAPGGKTVNVLNRLSSYDLCIANDYNHKRAQILSSNLERLGLDKTIVTCRKPHELVKELEGNCDIVILDAPCSGEGMLRKYPEIGTDYDLSSVKECSLLQKELLEDAYTALNQDGILLYSTCTYAPEEDEDQINAFLSLHEDMERIPLSSEMDPSLSDYVKLSPLNGTEGQFYCAMRKNSPSSSRKLRYQKECGEKTVEEYIKQNTDISDFHLYQKNGTYYMSVCALPEISSGILREGIEVGKLNGKRLEASHSFYRANSLKSHYRYVYDLSDAEYASYIAGNELFTGFDDGDYAVTYHGHSLGYGKARQGRLKNKYPKGLRRMV